MPTYRSALVAACTLWLLLSMGLLASFGTADDQPLLQAGDLSYVGGFRLPAQSVNGDDFSFGGQPIAYNPATNSLFVASYHGNVAEVNIPSPVNTGNVNAMPFASFVQPFADPTDGHLSDLSRDGVNVTGLMVSGNRLYGTASIYYDANNTQRVSHFSRSTQLSQPSFSGWSSVWQPERSGFVSGWMAAVPSEWQAALGAPAVTGQCCLPIAWRTSLGPAAIGFNPAQVGQGAVGGTPLLYYSLDHPTLGPWDASNPTFGATTQIDGLAIVAGSRTALFIGRNGLGPHCYGNGTSNQALNGSMGPDGAVWCYDPTNSDKGQHAYPYRYQVWAYNLNDLAAVRSGQKQPWDIVPYAVWSLNFPTVEATVRIGGVAYDAQRQLLYISQRGADQDTYANRPIIHVFRVSAVGGASAPPAVSTVSNVTLATDKASPQAAGATVTYTAQATGGVGPYQYKWFISDGTTTALVSDWNATNRYVWTPKTANPNYKAIVWVRSTGNTADVFEATASMSFGITAAATTVSSVKQVASLAAPQPAFTAITWTATPTGGVAPQQYKWFVTDGGKVTTVAANWSTTNTFVWTPATANANYHVIVWVRSAGSTAEQAEASADNAFAISAASTPPTTTPPVTPPANTTPPPTNTTPPVTTPPVTPPVTTPKISQVAVRTDKASPQAAGTTVVFIAQATSGVAPYQYQWSTFDGGKWNATGGWTTIDRLTWSRSSPGTYQVAVKVRSAGNTSEDGEASTTFTYVLTAASGKD